VWFACVRACSTRTVGARSNDVRFGASRKEGEDEDEDEDEDFATRRGDIAEGPFRTDDENVGRR
jgi:hypothetical protein